MRSLRTIRKVFLIISLTMFPFLYITNKTVSSSDQVLSVSDELKSDRKFVKSKVIQNVSQNKVIQNVSQYKVIQNVSRNKVIQNVSRNKVIQNVSRNKEIQNVSQNKEDLKYILQWTSPQNVPFVYMGKGQEGFIERKCPYTNCIVTANRSYFNDDITKFDVIAFAGPEVVVYETAQLPNKRSPHQKYVFASIESSHNYPLCSNKFNKYFNWTWTYRLDSEVRWGLIIIRDKNNAIIGPNKEMHWMKLEDMDPVSDDFKEQLKVKTKAAAWFVSNCYTMSKREVVAQELQEALLKYELRIDIFGTCGTSTCLIDKKDECDKLIKRNYYFYLSFENSLSEDYVTEKLLRALNNDAVPIVFGGANYTRFMPHGIYLNAEQLSAKDLALKMYELINNPKEYADYFKWKNHYSYHKNNQSIETNPYCLFCASLNNEEMVKTTTMYNDFHHWWMRPNQC